MDKGGMNFSVKACIIGGCKRSPKCAGAAETTRELLRGCASELVPCMRIDQMSNLNCLDFDSNRKLRMKSSWSCRLE
jgi:hypothetical protein